MALLIRNLKLSGISCPGMHINRLGFRSLSTFRSPHPLFRSFGSATAEAGELLILVWYLCSLFQCYRKWHSVLGFFWFLTLGTPSVCENVPVKKIVLFFYEICLNNLGTAYRIYKLLSRWGLATVGVGHEHGN